MVTTILFIIPPNIVATGSIVTKKSSRQSFDGQTCHLDDNLWFCLVVTMIYPTKIIATGSILTEKSSQQSFDIDGQTDAIWMTIPFGPIGSEGKKETVLHAHLIRP